MPAIICPHCDKEISKQRNPFPTVDAIVCNDNKILLIKRKNEPFGWALPGGFIDYGESAEDAVLRELFEETNLHGNIVKLLGVYSEPDRDPRQHNISIVFEVKANPKQIPQASDDALDCNFFNFNSLPELAFDHAKIIENFLQLLK